MGSVFGKLFCVSTFGESHGGGVGAVIDGCPARIELSASDIQPQLDRRRPGQSSLTTARTEKDEVSILSGTDGGLTLGTPISMFIKNTDARPGDYSELSSLPRPSHADFTYMSKYGIMSASGGGRASARETAGRVMGGAVAEKLLAARHGIEITAWVSSVGDIDAQDLTEEHITRAMVDSNAVRCPDGDAASRMEEAILRVKAEGDSLGGCITCVCRNVPAGFGEPVFDKLDALLAGAMLSIPSVKGFEIGSGFDGSRMLGSEHNDMFVMKNGRTGTATNRSGGVQGGISNGEPVVFRVAFKPVATIKKPQQTVDSKGNSVVMELIKGRHDPCVLPRAVPVVEAMAAMVLADLDLQHASRR